MNNNANDYNTEDYSVQNLLTLIKKMGDDKIIGKLTSIGRRSSSNTVFLANDILEESEKADVRTFDIEKIIQRFRKRCAKDYSPTSMQSHCSHARRSYALFLDYNKDPKKYPPDSYKIGLPQQRRQLSMKRPLKTIQALSNNNQIDNDNLFTFDLHVPVKGGEHMITISGIPRNIGSDDIKKVSAVILALS